MALLKLDSTEGWDQYEKKQCVKSVKIKKIIGRELTDVS
jgi:hypothetical protein